jgi:membrane protein DedA with SNARE-associated domain
MADSCRGPTGKKRNRVLEKTVFHWIVEYGYAAIFCLLMLGIVGLPVPDETLLTFSGFLIFKKQFHIAPTLLAAFFGSTCGITLSYTLGRTLGFSLIHKYGPYIHITEERVNRARGWLEHSGAWSLTFGYFVPGVRHLTAYVAGTSKLRLPIFALFAYSGGLIWSTTFVTLGYFLGNEWSRVSHEIHSYALMLTLVLAAGALIYFWFHKAQRGRAGN